MKKRILSTVLIVCMVLNLFLVPDITTEATNKIWNGTATPVEETAEDGSAGTGYYLIDTAEKLAWIASVVNTGKNTFSGKMVKLIDDIVLNEGDLSGYNGTEPNTWKQWEPIGTSTNSYLGSFNGDGHTISGIYVTGEKKYAGLFGALNTSPSNTMIYKVGITNSYISGQYAGSIAGMVYGTGSWCDVIGIYSEATVVGTTYTGGIAAYIENYGHVGNSLFNGKVLGNVSEKRVGSIAGYRNGGWIAISYYSVDSGVNVGLGGSSVSYEQQESFCKAVTSEQLKAPFVAYDLRSRGNIQLFGLKIGTDVIPAFVSNTHPAVYKTTYNGNGAVSGTTPTTAHYVNSGDTITIEDMPDYKRTSYIISDKWNSKADGSGIDYTVGSQIVTTAEDIVLHAKWITPSSDATVKVTSTVKGEPIISFGTPSDTLGTETAGTVTITDVKAGDTTNLTTFITSFDATDTNAVVKVVKYAEGSLTTNFDTDTAYSNGSITNGDFFIVKVTAQDGTTIKYYKIVVTVSPTPTDVPSPTPTDEPSPTPTDEPSPTPTDEPSPTPTDVPSPTPTDEPSPTPTDEPSPTPTDEPSPTPTDEPSPTPTDEPSPTPTDVPSPTPTDVPSPTPTDVPSPTPTYIPTPTSAPIVVFPTMPTPDVEVIIVEVKQGNTNNGISQVTIERTTDTKGNKSDTVIYEEAKAKQTIKKLREVGKDVARIVIPDEHDVVSQTTVTLPSSSLEALAKGDINLQIDTEKAKIYVPKDSLRHVNESFEKDLYFILKPIKEKEEKDEVTKRAFIQAANISGDTQNISMVSDPMIIETNMPSAAIEITLGLKGITLPTNASERESFLKQLAVYIEHSDGDKELVQGEIVEYKDGVLGMKVHITKFSIFTIVQTNVFDKSTACDILKVTTPLKATISGKKITTTVENKITSLTTKVTVSDKASWNLYSDKECKKELTNHKLKLKVGGNNVYLKVTAEDGITSKVYTLTITRKKALMKVLVVATKYDFTDALAGGVLAGQLGGTVISTGNTDKDAKKCVNYIKQNYSNQDEIYIIGLSQAINGNLEKILKKEGYTNIISIGGKDKYETAMKIADTIKLPEKAKVVLVNGVNKPKDSKNIQKVCAILGYPILFVETNGMSSYTIAALKKINPTQIYIAGDKTQFSTKVVRELKTIAGLDNSNVIRITASTDIK